MIKIMFVCTGNICRSAMAHGYAQKKINDLGRQEDVMISSCGTSAVSGSNSTKNAIEAIKEYDVDLSSHRATNINDIDIENYDLILCMTSSHKQTVLNLFPKLGNNVFTLKEYVDKQSEYLNIDDPWGLDLSIYISCAKEIVDNIDNLLNKI